jgi:hypothetical protein
MNFSTTDFTVFAIYIVAMIGFGVYLAFKEKNDTAESYFLASKTLPWWAIGGSLIASNISAEQMIGMSGSGYAIGLAIASYEFMAAATLAGGGQIPVTRIPGAQHPDHAPVPGKKIRRQGAHRTGHLLGHPFCLCQRGFPCTTSAVSPYNSIMGIPHPLCSDWT